MNRLRQLSWTLLVCHLTALIFGLVGILIMLPHPNLWAKDPNAVRVFDFSMKYAGSIHIVFGAATMLAFGLLALGWRKTGIFLALSYTISLSAELIGTGTGWPFGNYEYTDFLGPKALGRVPFAIPASWFYMGLASFLLGSALVQRLGPRREALWSGIAGAWFLTAWDLVLDPAMAHHSLRVKFWIWHQNGPYFGMPVKNFVGWTITGLLFMLLSRWVWRERSNPRDSLRIPVAVYIANLFFAMTLSAGVRLWIPILLAATLGLIPLAIAHRRQPRPSPVGKRLALDV
jgi:carotene biosynthesis associated membrane protein